MVRVKVTDHCLEQAAGRCGLKVTTEKQVRENLEQVVKDKLRNLNGERCPRLWGGTYDFYAIAQPTSLLQMDRDAYLLVRASTEGDWDWYVPTALDQEEFFLRKAKMSVYNDLTRALSNSPYILLTEERQTFQAFATLEQVAQEVGPLMDSGVPQSKIVVLQRKSFKTRVVVEF